MYCDVDNKYIYLCCRYGSMDNPVRQNLGQYRNQPGRIENYTTGKSSISEKESKQVNIELHDKLKQFLQHFDCLLNVLITFQ